MHLPSDERDLMDVCEYIVRRTSSGQSRDTMLIQMARHLSWSRRANLARTPEVMAAIERDTRRITQQMRIRGMIA